MVKWRTQFEREPTKGWIEEERDKDRWMQCDQIGQFFKAFGNN